MFLNCRTHSKETDEHFISKVMTWKILMEERHEATIECPLGSGVVDVFDRSTGIIYEMEPYFNKDKQAQKWSQYSKDAYVKDMVIIPYKKILEEIGWKEVPFGRDFIYKWKKELKKHLNL
jgi:hypothetical protein